MMRKKKLALLVLIILLLPCLGILPLTLSKYTSSHSQTIKINVRKPKYDIVFNINYGKRTDKITQQFTYDTEQNLKANSFVRIGYTFKEWNTKADGSGISYEDEQEIKNLTQIDGDKINLYAQWVANTYTITYDYDGGYNANEVVGKYDASSSLNNNTTLADLSGNGNNGTFVNTKVTNDHMLFNGESSWVKFSRMNYNYMILEATFTVNSFSNQHRILSNIQQGGIEIAVYNTSGINGRVHVNGNYNTISANIFPEPEKKYHVVLSYDGYYLKMFINGTLVNTISLTGTIKAATSSTIMALGANPKGTTSDDGTFLDGKIYSAAIYSYTIGSKTVTYDDVYGSLPTPTKTGYTFEGWYIDDKLVDADSVVQITNDTRLIAKYKPNTYTIKYHANGCDGSTIPDSVVTYDEEINLRKNLYKKDDYTYIVWNTKADGTGITYLDEENILNLTDENNGVINLYAQPKYKINYDLKGGSDAEENLRFYDKNTGSFKLKNPTKEGSKFLGWTGSNGDVPELDVTIAENTTGDLQFIANYADGTLYIKYHANGGSMASQHSSDFSINSDGTILHKGSEIHHTLMYGDSLGSTGLINWANSDALNIYRTGYTIDSGVQWNTKADGSGVSYNQHIVYMASDFCDLMTDDCTVILYANWRPINYTITFDKNSSSATGTMQKQTFTYDKSQILNVNKYVNSGYTFSGWNTKADGSGISYSDKEEILNLSSKNGENVTLYAQWK